uniref:Uncharacterized protein n=1 Tax=Anopheles melas TaxID=34690 RepID=A0A182TTK2_9DIPT
MLNVAWFVPSVSRSRKISVRRAPAEFSASRSWNGLSRPEPSVSYSLNTAFHLAMSVSSCWNSSKPSLPVWSTSSIATIARHTSFEKPSDEIGWFGTIWLSKLAGPEGCVPPPPPPSPSPPRTPLQHMFSSMLSRSSMPPPGPAGPASAFCCDAYVCRFSPFREDVLVSENTRMMNSPSSFGSNVDGTITYVPGGSLNRQLTSRKLMNAGDRAADALYLKKFIFSGFWARSRSVTRYTANPIVRHSTPMLRRERRFFCSSAMITVQLPSSSSSSGSSSRITYCGLCQNVSR